MSYKFEKKDQKLVSIFPKKSAKTYLVLLQSVKAFEQPQTLLWIKPHAQVLHRDLPRYRYRLQALALVVAVCAILLLLEAPYLPVILLLL